ncbi:MAG: MFS transporter [Sulfitobacter sp.]
MSAGIFLLGLAYVLSQFFRAFLAVLAPVLERDIGATPAHLSDASGFWFLAFAALQIPIGAALDSTGPRRTAAVLLLLGGGGGAALFAMATSPLHINIAMALIGVGCAPVLMAAYYIFAREYPPAQFAVLASVIVGIGTLGNLVASYPMAIAAEHLGWRQSLWGLAAISGLVAVGIWVLVKDPAKVEGESSGSLLELFRIRPLWFIFPLMGLSYALLGALRGLWVGPYLADVFGANTNMIGQITLAMGIAMIAGTLAYGPLDRAAPSRKWLVVAGSTLTLMASTVLVLLPAQSLWLAVMCICVIGLCGTTYPVIMAHGRSFLPPHLIGRGVTMLNLFSIGGVGVMQFASGRLYQGLTPNAEPSLPYVAVFALLSAALGFGLLVYLLAKDSPD